MKKNSKRHTGIIHMHHRGFGFITPDNTRISDQDIFIPRHLTMNAVNGDHVEFEIEPKQKSGKGPEGFVTNILERSRSHLVGTITYLPKTGPIYAFVPIIGDGRDVIVKKSKKLKLKVGSRVYLQVEDWGEEESDPLICRVEKDLGHISDAEIDIPIAITEYDIPATFPEEVIAEARAFGEEVSPKDLKNRTDFRELETFTIDPETAKDFDDALSIQKDSKGYHVAVHIADVSHYVKQGSKLDEEAKMRGNSTYFPGKCIPMLPEELSNNLCSLKENVLRLTATVLMQFDLEGNLLSSKIERGYIKSNKRFTYEEAKEVIDGKQSSSHAKSLQEMVELCLLLKKKRTERGCIDLALPEVSLHIDEKGMPTGYRIIEYDISHQLVEEFMLKSNEIVGKELSDRGNGGIYRVHEEPSEQNLNDFYILARALGFNLPDKPTPEDIQKLFEQARISPFAHQIAVGYIRSMKLAIYSEQNIGHYGLSLEYYSHFTSPIRRYSDLIAHRLLFESKIDVDLEEIAKHCSEKERLSFRAETSVTTLKKLRYLRALFKEDPNKVYDAIVNKVRAQGIHFEVTSLMLEGFIHVSELSDDYYNFIATLQMLQGTYEGREFKVGTPIQVRLDRVDLIFQDALWRIA